MSRNVIKNISKFSNAEEILGKCLDLLCINDVEVQIKQSSLISKAIASFSGVMQKCPYGDNIYELILDADIDDDKLMKNVVLHECCHLKQMVEAVNDLKIAIEELSQSINEGGGSSITLDQLEELWKQHDEANYNRYKELLENLEINVDVNTTNLEELLQTIDNKLNYLQENNDILKQILNKLEGIDWTDPDYSAKLDRIIEILENFKCNCDCGNSNEGILGDLDEVLG